MAPLKGGGKLYKALRILGLVLLYLVGVPSVVVLIFLVIKRLIDKKGSAGKSGTLSSAGNQVSYSEDKAVLPDGRKAFCPSCGAAVPSGSSICLRCGTAVSIVCQGCGTGNPAFASFCGKCGRKLDTRGEGNEEDKVC